MQLSRSTHEMNASWNHMTVAKGALQAQFSLVESSLLLNSGMRMRTSAKMLVYEVNSRPALHARQFGNMSCTQPTWKCNSLLLKPMPAEPYLFLEVRSVQEEYFKASSELTEVTGQRLASRDMLLTFEQQASTWKEELTKADMTTLSNEVIALRGYMSVGSSVDDMLSAKCMRLEQDREDMFSLLGESVKRWLLPSAKRWIWIHSSITRPGTTYTSTNLSTQRC